MSLFGNSSRNASQDKGDRKAATHQKKKKKTNGNLFFDLFTTLHNDFITTSFLQN